MVATVEEPNTNSSIRVSNGGEDHEPPPIAFTVDYEKAVETEGAKSTGYTIKLEPGRVSTICDG